MEKKRYTIHVSETLYSWRDIEIEAESEEEAKELAEDQVPDAWTENGISDVETTILAINGEPVKTPRTE